MKKKFLSLMMAAAVVATTSVSAFASTQTINSSNDVERSAEVKVEGKVADDSGALPSSGTFNVTIPSKVAFSIDRNGVFTGVELPIVNNGDHAISVKVANFVDTDGEEGIKLNHTEDLRDSTLNVNKNRSEINLTLQGNRKKVYLGDGKVRDKLGSTAADLSNVEMAEVAIGATEKLQLEGYAGKHKLGDNVSAITNNFTLTFKISKKQV